MSGEVEQAPLSGPSGPPKLLGRMLAGRYRLQGILGEGGMAIVYEGEHVAIGKRVAIKIVQSIFANDDEIVSRFEREARSAGAVESEHIVHVFDVGADPELGLFLVMELLKGEDLGHVLARRTRLDPDLRLRHRHAGRAGSRKGPRGRHRPPRFEARERVPRRAR